MVKLSQRDTIKANGKFPVHGTMKIDLVADEKGAFWRSLNSNALKSAYKSVRVELDLW